MWVIPFIVLQIVAVEIQAAGFKLEHDLIKITDYDKKHVRSVSAEIFQYNATSKAYNISIVFIEDVPKDLKIGMLANKLQGKVYRQIGAQFAPNFCDLFAHNEFGVRTVYDYSNFHGCPIKKDINYYVANFMLGDDKLPPTMIAGKFRTDLNLFSTSKKVNYFTAEWFLGIVKA